MPINKKTQRTFYKTLYATEMQKVVVYPRGDDQQQGTVRAVTVFNARRSMITHAGQPIQRKTAAGDRVTWHLPAEELNRAGINWINALTRIHDPIEGTTWQPEAGTTITVKLFANWFRVECLWCDPAQ